MSKKEQVIALRKQGLSYREIQKQVPVCRSMIAYYLNPELSVRRRKRQIENRYMFKDIIRKMHGGKCSICGYQKCLKALDFHHLDPTSKNFLISDALHTNMGKKQIIEESKKCILICANCHRELHDDLIDNSTLKTSFVSEMVAGEKIEFS